MDSSDLDAVDYAILYQLQENARKSITDIASAVDVSDNTVRNRMQSLEERGVIEGYQVNVDYDAAGVQHYYLFVCSAGVRDREALAAEARDHDDVVEVISLMTGKYNVYVIGACSNKDVITELAYDLDELGLKIEREHLVREHSRRSYDGFRPKERA